MIPLTLKPNTIFGIELKEGKYVEYWDIDKSTWVYGVWKSRIRENFDAFVNRPLEIGQFVPCKDGVPLVDPRADGPMCRDCADSDGTCPNDGTPCDPDVGIAEYEAAQKAVLFTGFTVALDDENDLFLDFTTSGEQEIDMQLVYDKCESIFYIYGENEIINTLEDLSQFNLPLSDTSIAEIFGK